MELTLRVNTQAGTTVVRLFKDSASPRSYKEFACLVSCRGKEYRAWIPALNFKDFFEFVRSASICPLGGCGLGLDGTSYELTIEEGLAQANYQWWMNPVSGWTPLTEIANRLLQLGFQVSGQYLP